MNPTTSQDLVQARLEAVRSELVVRLVELGSTLTEARELTAQATTAEKIGALTNVHDLSVDQLLADALRTSGLRSDAEVYAGIRAAAKARQSSASAKSAAERLGMGAG